MHKLGKTFFWHTKPKKGWLISKIYFKNKKPRPKNFSYKSVDKNANNSEK